MSTARALQGFLSRNPGTRALLEPKKRRRGPEGNLIRAILDRYERDPRVFLFRQSVGMMRTPDGQRQYRMGLPGCADITGWLRGSARRVEIECKAGTGQLRSSQEHFRKLCERDGVLYVVARSVEDVEKALRGGAASQ